MAEEKKTNRQLIGERFKSRNPEFNVDDDEAMYGEALAELGKADEAEEARKRLNKTITNNKIAPDLLTGLISGKNEDGSDFDLDEYMLDRHIDYLLDYAENKETAKEKLKARKKQREIDAANEEETRKLAEAALAKEDAELDAAIKEAGYRQEQVKDLIDWIYDKEKGFITRAKKFELTKDDFIRLFHIKDWDLKMKEADDAGYKRGKNEKIDMFRRQQKKRGEMPADATGSGVSEKGEQPDQYLAKLQKMKNF